MRKIFAIVCFLLMYGAAFGQLSQFRMIGSGSWSTVNDSTFSSTVTIQADLTSNGFLPTGITDSMLVFSQTGQRYTISSAINLTFSSADLTIVESGGDWGTPVGQVMIYEDNGNTAVPNIPFGATGATAKMQEAVDTYNSSVIGSGSISDGDKGEITVGGGGSNWVIDDNVITSVKILDGTIATADIADEAVTGAKIAENTVANNNLTATGVTAASYTNANITVNSAGRITAASNGSGAGNWTIDNDTIETASARINIGASDFPSNDGGFFHIPNRAIWMDQGFNGEPNFFFGDYADWSSRHSSAALNQANNFHYWTQGNNNLVRVEFENDSAPLQFYIEGIGEAWYGLQNGSTHLWSSGYKTSTTSTDWVWNPAFGLDATPVMRLSTAGRLTVDEALAPGSMTTAEKNALTSVPTGAIVHDSDLSSLQMYNGSSWDGIGGSSTKSVVLSSGNTIDLTSSANGIYNLNVSATDVVNTIALSNPVNGGEYAFWFEGCSSDTITFPDNFLTVGRDSLKTRLCQGDELMDFFYDGTNYITKDTIWTRVNSSGGGGGGGSTFLLDEVSGATVAYGLRKLRDAYSGNCIEVRRSSDGTTSNIGFLGEALDTTTLMTFCSGTDCFIRTWYDQSTSGFDAVQTTDANQPNIVNGGSLRRDGGYPTILWDSVDDALLVSDNDALSATDGAGTDSDLNAFFVFNKDGGNGVVFGKDGGGSTREYAAGTFSGTGNIRLFLKDGGGSNQQSYDETNIATGHTQISILYDGSESYTGIQIYGNGTAATMGSEVNQSYSGMSNTTAQLRIGNYGAANAGLGSSMQELVIWFTDQSGNRTTIENNQKAFYGL